MPLTAREAPAHVLVYGTGGGKRCRVYLVTELLVARKKYRHLPLLKRERIRRCTYASREEAGADVIVGFAPV